MISTLNFRTLLSNEMVKIPEALFSVLVSKWRRAVGQVASRCLGDSATSHLLRVQDHIYQSLECQDYIGASGLL